MARAAGGVTLARPRLARRRVRATAKAAKPANPNPRRPAAMHQHSPSRHVREVGTIAGRTGWDARVVVAAALLAWALWTFARGFFLHRLSIRAVSECPGPNGTAAPYIRGCWAPARFDRALVVVVDALRYDFVRPFSEAQRGAPAMFHNRMPFLGQLVSDGTGRARLYAFEADPPTVTMQRIKGLTTGSLPTFIDAGSNFGGAAIEEDSIPAQARLAGLRTAFVGDDTWEDLFPGVFNVSLPFPSFNVHDLHTVDNGVIGALVPGLGLESGPGRPRLRGSDPGASGGNRTAGGDARHSPAGWLAPGAGWDLAIAHTLGVDHAGHRFGPAHPAMAAKLAQTDAVLRAVFERLDDRTLLAVLGDHGMTPGGNHGGGTPRETNAALVLAARTPVGRPAATGSSDADWFDAPLRCRQTDLVPTLSFLLGLPVPAASLGAALPGLRYAGPGEDAAGAEARRLLANGRQVLRYLTAYGREAPAFRDVPRVLAAVGGLERAVGGLEREAAVAAGGEGEGGAGLGSAVTALRAALRAAADACREQWTRFDEPAMLRGVVLALAAACVAAGGVPGQAEAGAATLAAAVAAAWGAAGLGSSGAAGWARGAVGDAATGTGPARLAAWAALAVAESPACAAAAAAGAAALWRHGPSAARCRPGPASLVAAASLVLAGTCPWSNSLVASEGLVAMAGSAAVLCSLSLISAVRGGPWREGVLAAAATRAAWGMAPLHGPASGAGWQHAWAGAAAVAGLSLWVLPQRRAGAGGRAPGSTLSVVSCALTCASAALAAASLSAGADAGRPARLWAPRAAMGLSAAALGSAVASRRQGGHAAGRALALQPALALVPLVGVLAGPAGAAAASLQVAALGLAAVAVGSSRAGLAERAVVLAALLHLQSRAHFEASGHGTSFSSLRFRAAFVGFERYSFARGAVMMAADTLSSSWLTLAALPAALALAGGSGSTGKAGADAAGAGPPVVATALAPAVGRAWLAASAILLSSTLASLLWLRRHLMVWAVFAPRLAFDAAMLALEVAAAVALAARARP